MKNNKVIFLIIFSLLVIFIFFYLNYLVLEKRSKASKTNFINFDTEKAFIKRRITTKKLKQFSFYTPSNSTQALVNFSSSEAKLGLGALVNKNLNGLIDLSKNDQFTITKKKTLKGTHFYYQQKVNNIPIFGSSLVLHYNDQNQLYGFSGNLIENQAIGEQKISEGDAQKIALDFAKKENNRQDLEIYYSEKNILNKKLLGIGEDENNYLALVVWIKNQSKTPIFLVRYFVSLTDGEILFQENMIHEVLNRIIYSCEKNGICLEVRSEGKPVVVGNNDVNKAYKFLGQTYNFLNSEFKLDSFDNQGSPLIGFVHYPYQCPNAFFDSFTKTIYLCDGMVTGDIIGHEIGHGVTDNYLIYSYQSGAINESLSDIYAYGVDPDWNFGEDSILGTVRRMDDPLVFNQPDRLFSEKYFCDSKDQGGVHINSGILNKAFYLMVKGGNFNGCELKPIGSHKAWQIIYRAITVYITPTANFRDVYEAVLNACYDLYGQASADCINAQRVMQAVEIDQQTPNDQKSPVCFGEKPKTPGCVSLQPTTNISPNLSPTQNISVKPIISPSLTPPLISPTLPEGNTNIDLKIRFQGINKKPKTPLFLLVNISLVDDKGKRQSGIFPFSSDENGIWVGKVIFNLPKTKSKYYFLIKGPKHLQKKICDEKPMEKDEGYYYCEEPKIELSSGNYSFDFSKITLLAGDLPKQDGIVNALDLAQVRQYLSLTSLNDVLVGDVNYDGIINTQDYSMILYTLSFKFDN